MVMAGLLVGVRFGSMLGSPVNVLITEQAGEKNKGDRRGDKLPVQTGYTPTLFAGFLARSFMNLKMHISKGFADY